MDDRDEDLHRIVQMRINGLIEKLRRIREGDDGEEIRQENVPREEEERSQVNKREEDRLKE